MAQEQLQQGKDQGGPTSAQGEAAGAGASVATAPGNTSHKLAAALMLIISTACLIYGWFFVLRFIETNLQIENTVEWQAPPDIALQSGPVAFWFDRKNNKLVYKGIIDTPQKSALVSLLKADDVGKDKKTLYGYWAAIDKLAYESNKVLSRFTLYLLLLGGISGVLGVQLRSLNNFVGITSYKDELNVPRWWPWYVIRPFSGFILGMIVVVIVQIGMITPGETVPRSTLWWVGISLLAGFGADEFTQRLRLLSQTLFGEKK